MMKREGYASENCNKFEKKMEKIMNRCHERVIRSFGKKMRKIRKNLQKEDK